MGMDASEASLPFTIICDNCDEWYHATLNDECPWCLEIEIEERLNESVSAKRNYEIRKEVT